MSEATVSLDELRTKRRQRSKGAASDREPPQSKKPEKRFDLRENGWYRRVTKVDKETGIETHEWHWFASRFEIMSMTRSEDGQEWGRELHVVDPDGKRHKLAMPMSDLSRDISTVLATLYSHGLSIASGQAAKHALHDLLNSYRVDARSRCVSRIGWHGKAYVLADMTIGDQAERVILQTSGATDNAMRLSGTLTGWQENVARYAIDNSRLTLGLCVAFVGPLLGPTGGESGIFHLRGASSTGKSTALIVAGSVWGGGGIRGYQKQWRATSNGMEAVAAMHNDALLCLDELSQVEGREVGTVTYMLGNGSGKSRAGRSGEARPVVEWRIAGFSSGEIGITDKIAEDGRGRRAAAGQQVRILDIPADAGAGMGLFEELHGFPSADAFARHLKRAAETDFGHPARAYLQSLIERFDDIAPEVKAFVEDFTAENVPQGADGQVTRAAARFGLAAAAGEMAAGAGILPWPQGEARRGVARCFKDWLTTRGGSRPAEETEALATVRRFIGAHGNSRFEAIGELIPTTTHGERIDQRVVNRVGFRRRSDEGGIDYCVLPDMWKAEVCAGSDPHLVARVLAEHGFLRRGDKLQAKVRLPDFGSTWCYVVKGAILGDEEPAPATGPTMNRRSDTSAPGLFAYLRPQRCSTCSTSPHGQVEQVFPSENNAVPPVPPVPPRNIEGPGYIRDGQDWRDAFDERAAWLEYEEGLPRVRAEQLALEQIAKERAMARDATEYPIPARA